MRYPKRIIAAVLLLGILLFLVTCTPKKSTRICFLVTSDLQSQVFPHQVTMSETGKKKTILAGGLAKISTLARNIKEETDGVLLLSTGDDLMVPFYEMFKGVPEIKAMNLAGYNVVTPGNHEFDLGVKTYASTLKKASFDIVSSNLYINDTQLSSLIKPFVIKTVEGVKIGVFGLMTPELPRVSNVGKVIKVDDVIKTAVSMVKTLKGKDVDLIVALTHIGTALDIKLAKTVSGIDFIVGGHTHDYLYKRLKTGGRVTIIVHAGAGGTKVGTLCFTYTGKIEKLKWQIVMLDDTIPNDPKIDQFLEPFKKEYEKKLSEPVGVSLVDLDAKKEIIRKQESNLGNLIADSWLDWFKNKGNRVDCAMMNAGGIRGDRIYPAGAISLKTLLEIHPFGNTVYMVTLTGKQLLQALEISASTIKVPVDGCSPNNRPHDGAFLQVSGLRMQIDVSKKPFCAEYNGREITKLLARGKRVIRAEIFRNGTWKPVQKEKVYRVLVNSWLASGGDGYYVFNKAQSKKDTTFRIVDLLAFYVKKHSPIKPVTEGRITIFDTYGLNHRRINSNKENTLILSR